MPQHEIPEVVNKVQFPEQIPIHLFPICRTQTETTENKDHTPGSQPWAMVPSRRHWLKSGDIFHDHCWGKGPVTNI
jgi:hypothetical protein